MPGALTLVRTQLSRTEGLHNKKCKSFPRWLIFSWSWWQWQAALRVCIWTTGGGGHHKDQLKFVSTTCRAASTSWPRFSGILLNFWYRALPECDRTSLRTPALKVEQKQHRGGIGTWKLSCFDRSMSMQPCNSWVAPCMVWRTKTLLPFSGLHPWSAKMFLDGGRGFQSLLAR